jgi:hypothetical protein
MAVLHKHGVQINGVSVYKGMISTILPFGDKIGSDSVAILRAIERAHGPDCLTGGYAEIARICTICSKEADEGSVPELAMYNDRCIKLSLDMGLMAAKDVTVDVLDKAKDNTPGVVLTGLGRRALVHYFVSLVDDLSSVMVAKPIADEMARVLVVFHDCYIFEPSTGGR